MINRLLRYALQHRLTVLLVTLAALGYGGWVIGALPVDVFPDLNRPIVTVLTEAHGLAPDEVEAIVTMPIESAFSGIPGVLRVRSSSGVGISIIYVEFDWGTDVFRNRQLVAERLQLLAGRLPDDMTPILAPISSIMGEIQFVGLTSPDGAVAPMDLRTLADWTVRPQLMTIAGVSQVVVMGGDAKQYQILLSADKLLRHGITLAAAHEALQRISENTSGGFVDRDGKEYLIRPIGRVESIADIEATFIAMHLGRPVLVKDVATVVIGPRIKRGEGSINGKHAVIMTIQKQPGADTVTLTHRIDAMLEQLRAALPAGVQLESDLFKQSHFIETSLFNVQEALLLGGIMVACVLLLFFWNGRITFITLTAIPLSFVVTAIVFHWLGLSVNTMTLGGLAIAIGELVDDAIVDVENIYRRLRENRLAAQPRPALHVIYEASSEVRNSIVFSTIIVILVFVPLFALSGMEGRLFAPLGVAYIVSLAASLLTSLTVTPVLSYYLLPHSALAAEHDNAFVRWLKRRVRGVLERVIDRPYPVLLGSGALVVAALLSLPYLGRTFLPAFNEGTATIGVAAGPGIALGASDALGRRIEEAILRSPEVKSTIRRTGRAEMDEHAEGVHWHEIDVDFHEGGRERGVVLQEIRTHILEVGDVAVNLGQPISHRLDHLLSGVRAQLAIKIFGPDLAELRRLGGEVMTAVESVTGLVDVQTEPLVLVPQLKIAIDRPAASAAGLSAGGLAEDLETALNGTTVSRVVEEQKLYDIFMRLDDASREDFARIKNLPVKILPTGAAVTVQDVANVYPTTGPNMINREDLLRRIVVSANTQGRDLGSVVEEVQQRIRDSVQLPAGYFIKYGGQFESQQQASRLIFWLGLLSLAGIFFVLYLHFRSVMLSVQIMLNVPLALIGSVLAIWLTERTLSVATLVGFITLCGIASRNGILLISHYVHLLTKEGETFGKAMIIRGSLERLIPVAMTALSAILALIPIALARGEPGREILYPVAVVIIGGLVSSTLLDILVTPAVFYKFCKHSAARLARDASRSTTLPGGEHV